eukprot:scaffold2643_cov387-Prasinococcus_capsulatus_cf.AAC.12
MVRLERTGGGLAPPPPGPQPAAACVPRTDSWPVWKRGQTSPGGPLRGAARPARPTRRGSAAGFLRRPRTRPRGGGWWSLSPRRGMGRPHPARARSQPLRGARGAPCSGAAGALSSRGEVGGELREFARAPAAGPARKWGCHMGQGSPARGSGDGQWGPPRGELQAGGAPCRGLPRAASVGGVSFLWLRPARGRHVADVPDSMWRRGGPATVIKTCTRPAHGRPAKIGLQLGAR